MAEKVLKGKQTDYTKPLFIRLENHLKARLISQCERLNISQAALVKMALVRFLEEEETIQYKANKRD